MNKICTALAALALGATGAMAQTGQSDTDARSDSGSLSAGQKEAMPATQGKGENQRQEPASGAASDSAASGSSTGDAGSDAAGNSSTPDTDGNTK